jgi:NTP pyrophosphohydrolases including oxidative damage repair enzymes
MDKKDLIETVIAKERKYDGGIINIEKWQVRLPNGEIASRDVVLHIGAAAVVPMDESGRVAMVRQFRCPIGRVTLELPAGKLDSQTEDPLLCAKRELEEETGLHAANWQKLIDSQTTPAFCTEKISIYLATGLSQHESHTDEDEFISAEFIPLEELLTMVRQGTLVDGKTVTGLLLAKDYLSNN